VVYAFMQILLLICETCFSGFIRF